MKMEKDETMAIIKETKYLTFVSETLPGRKIKLIHVNSKSSGAELATIEWYGSWRQYCLMPAWEYDTIWSNACLPDVISVIDMLNDPKAVMNEIFKLSKRKM